MNIQALRRNTLRPSTALLFLLWWASVFLTLVVVWFVFFRQRDDLPNGAFVAYTPFLLITLWHAIFDSLDRKILRAITERAAVWLCTAANFALLLMAIMLDWEAANLTIVGFGAGIGATTGLLGGLGFRRYVKYQWRWLSLCGATGALAVLSGLYVARLQSSAAEQPDPVLAGIVFALVWIAFPGIVLARQMRTLPTDVLPDLLEYLQRPPTRLALWFERWKWPINTMAVALVVLAFAIPGLRQCGWLDRLVGRSGCVQRIELVDGSVGQVTWLPDGVRIAMIQRTIEQQTINLIDATDWSIEQTIALGDTSSGIARFSFAPDSLTYASLIDSFDNSIKQIDIRRTADGEVARSLDTTGNHVIFSPDGTLIASGNQVWRVSDGTLVHQFDKGWEVSDFSPDGELISAIRDFETVGIWRRDGWDQQTVIRGLGDDVRAALFSPDGQTLAVRIGSDHVRLYGVDGQPVRNVAEARSIWTMKWAPNRPYLALSGSNENAEYDERGWLRVIDATTGETVVDYDKQPDSIESLSWSPDGSMIVTTSDYDEIQILRVPITGATSQ